jgi:hypothetical protein
MTAWARVQDAMVSVYFGLALRVRFPRLVRQDLRELYGWARFW